MKYFRCAPQVCTDLVKADDLTVGLLDLPQAGEEVPETALSNNRVGRKNAHTVELGSRLRLGGQMTANDLVFVFHIVRDHHYSTERKAPVQILLKNFLLFQPIAKSRCRSALAADPARRECLPICAIC